jgi:uncharacterized protein (UPF0262 family)
MHTVNNIKKLPPQLLIIFTDIPCFSCIRREGGQNIVRHVIEITPPVRRPVDDRHAVLSDLFAILRQSGVTGFPSM